MGLFDFISGKTKNINEYIDDLKNKDNCYLIDVRTPEEYNSGHIPSSINVPLQSIYNIEDVVKDKNADIYVYCRSGARSGRSVSFIKSMGYSNITNIGGIMDYTGKTV